METIGGPDDGSSTLPSVSLSFGTAVNRPGLWGAQPKRDRLVDRKLKTCSARKDKSALDERNEPDLSLARRLTKDDWAFVARPLAVNLRIPALPKVRGVWRNADPVWSGNLPAVKIRLPIDSSSST